MAQELDVNFQRRLLETLERDQLSEINSLIKNRRLRKLIYNFNRVTMNFLAASQRIRLDKECELKPKRRSMSQMLGKFWRISSLKLLTWGQMVLLIYIISAAALWINVYYQYIYDVNTIKLHRLEIRASPNQTLADSIQRRADGARQVLHSLGAWHFEWPFVVQTFVLIFSLSGSNAVILLWIQHDLHDWTLLAPLMLLNPDMERRARLELIMDELRLSVSNSLSFTRAEFDQLVKDLLYGIGEFVNDNRSSESLGDRALVLFSQNLVRGYRFLVRRLKECALEGRFNPLNRRLVHRDQFALISLLLALVIIIFIYAALIVFYIFLCHKSRAQGERVDFNSLAETLNAIALAIFIQCHTNACVLIGLLMGTVGFDQFQSITKMRSLINQVIRANEIRLISLWTGTRLDSKNVAELVDEIERDSLTVILQSRLFDRAFELTRRPISHYSLVAVLFGFGVLIVSRIHNPYFEANIRLVWLVFCVAYSGFAFIYLIPLGLLHRRIIKTYSLLWQLAAQLSQFATFSNAIHRRRLQDVNTGVVGLWLRRHLTDTPESMDQFAYRVLSLKITNQNLIRLGFWAFLVVLSLTSNVNLFGEGFAAVLSDPLRLNNTSLL